MAQMRRNTKIGIGVVVAVIVVLIICAFVPISYWQGSISSERYVSEGTVSDIDESNQTMTVRLYSATADGSGVETDTSLILQGDLYDKAYIGQDVRIGYSEEGLYADTSQSVQVSYYITGDALNGFIIQGILQLRPSADKMQIEEVQSDGTDLNYHVME